MSMSEDMNADEQPLSPDASGRFAHPRRDRVARAIEDKTIAAAVFDGDEVTLRFTDGTWIHGEWEGDGIEGSDVATDDWTVVPTPMTLLRADIIDHAEYRRRDEAERARWDVDREIAERKRLAELKAKYEGGPGTA